MNSIDAMKAVNGTRELTIQSHSGEDGQMLTSVSDSGVSLLSEQADKIRVDRVYSSLLTNIRRPGDQHHTITSPPGLIIFSG